MADNAVVRHNEKNEAIQEELSKKAKRKDLLDRIVPYFGLIFILIFFLYDVIRSKNNILPFFFLFRGLIHSDTVTFDFFL